MTSITSRMIPGLVTAAIAAAVDVVVVVACFDVEFFKPSATSAHPSICLSK